MADKYYKEYGDIQVPKVKTNVHEETHANKEVPVCYSSILSMQEHKRCAHQNTLEIS